MNIAMESTINDINTAITDAKNNVTRNLQTTSLALQLTQDHVKKELNNTINTINNVVDDATIKIQTVQNNVTEQLAIMTVSLDTTKIQLNDVVKQAESTIHSEVYYYYYYYYYHHHHYY